MRNAWSIAGSIDAVAGAAVAVALILIVLEVLVKRVIA
jgi:hypothetical protein